MHAPAIGVSFIGKELMGSTIVSVGKIPFIGSGLYRGVALLCAVRVIRERSELCWLRMLFVLSLLGRIVRVVVPISIVVARGVGI